MRDEEQRGGRQPLPLEARRALWRKVWDRLLMPEALRAPDDVPAHERKNVAPDRDGIARESR